MARLDSRGAASGGRRFARSLHESEEKFRLLVEGVKEYAIYLLDPDGRVMSWNAGAERLKGWAADEIIGQHVSVFHPPETVAQGRPQEELRIAREQGVFREEARRKRKDGSEFIADITLTALYGEDKELRGYAKITRDITDRKRTEDALRASEEKLRLLVESIEDYAIFMLDPDGRVISWNAAAQRMKGWAAGEIIGQHVSVFHTPEAIAQGRPQQELRIAREEGVFREEALRRRKDGSEFYADVILTALYDRDILRGFAKITRDISERKRVEARLEERNRALDAANRELQAFAHSVAHDLRAPLRAMRGFSQALIEDHGDRLDSSARDYLDRIATAAVRMDGMIADLLAYARLGREDVPLAPVSLQSIARAVSEQVSAQLADSKGTLTVAADLPVVRGNPTLLVQLMANLVQNSLKFTAPGVAPVVRIWSEPRGARIRTWIADNGIGIAPEHQERIFEVFQRLHGITEYEGTGIGLALVRRAVERMGGRAGVESQSGQGSKFWFELAKG